MNKKEETIIKVENLSKVFKLPHERLSTVRQHFVNIFRPKRYEQFKALDNVSFEIKKGEFFGIIGANGSGKSTLLKILAGVYQPTSGKVEIKGSLSPFIELGVGFNPELTARENIFLNAAILGMSKKQTEERFEEIIKFSELENFLDQKLKNFSSGMQVRLAFSIAIQAHADILLVDEVLAVGDVAFQEKCLSLFRELKNNGKTIIFVTHGLDLLEEFSDRILYLRRGRLVSLGTPSEIILTYLRDTGENQLSKEKPFEKNTAIRNVKINDIKFFTNNNRETKIIETGKKLEVTISFVTTVELKNPVVGIALYREDGVQVTGPNTETSGFKLGKIKGEKTVKYTVDNLPLLPGKYFLSVGIFEENHRKVLDFLDRKASFKVISNLPNKYGLLKLDEKWVLGD